MILMNIKKSIEKIVS